MSAGRSTATILHADLDSFYASVEQRDDPSLRGRAVVVGGGVVLAASYEAKAFGVRTAMSGAAARRVCPNLIEVPPRFEAYTEASKAVFEIFRDTSPIVEPMSIDEAFIDVGGLWRLSGTPSAIATRLRGRVADEVGLPLSIGVARTKFLAKVASAVSKPDGLLVVEPDGELDFLHPLPVQRLWGVGTVTATKLHERGLHTVADVAAMSPETLVAIVGRAMGHQLHALAHNRDARRVTTGRRRGSIGSQQALGRRLRSRDEIDVVLWRLVDRITGRMRTADRVGRTVTLRFRFDDFTRATRSHSLPDATAGTAAVHATAAAVLDAAWPLVETKGITLLGVSVGNLTDLDAVQLVLPFHRTESEQLDVVTDAVRARFGRGALQRATTLRGNPGVQLPMLPD
ncbi:MAG TPA: DNA polymerase IV [Ilumatobacteraceae bacterium]|nr:DNA polymerase IV [Ilumatobacteraceae bacterium]